MICVTGFDACANPALTPPAHVQMKMADFRTTGPQMKADVDLAIGKFVILTTDMLIKVRSSCHP